MEDDILKVLALAVEDVKPETKSQQLGFHLIA
jgi:hypothetical protein